MVRVAAFVSSFVFVHRLFECYMANTHLLFVIFIFIVYFLHFGNEVEVVTGDTCQVREGVRLGGHHLMTVNH